MDPLSFYKAIADATRLRATLLLCQTPELCVCDLVQALGESQPKVSRHLALLKQACLLQHRRQGLWIFYRLHPQLPAWVIAVLQHTWQQNPDFINENLTRLAQNPANACC